jgi:hypothetical protein
MGHSSGSTILCCNVPKSRAGIQRTSDAFTLINTCERPGHDVTVFRRLTEKVMHQVSASDSVPHEGVYKRTITLNKTPRLHLKLYLPR